MNQNSRMPWILAGLLLLSLVVVSVLLLQTRRDLKDVLAEGRGDITSQRDEIARKCTGDDVNEDECNRALGELADILREFNADLTASATTTAE